MGIFDLFKKATTKSIQVTADQVEVKGKVIANLLNVRQKPSLKAKVVGRLRRNDIVLILNDLGDWYEILWNRDKAYVYKKYILLIAYIKRGKVTARLLNVRQFPSIEAPVVGKLTKNTQVFIVEEILDWYGIEYKGRVAYVAKQYVEAYDLPPIGGEQAVGKYFCQRQDLLNYPLEPENKLKGNSKAVRIWNSFGGLVKRVSMELAIEPAAPLAVIKVESGGQAFDKNGRMIIRFEAHAFRKFLVNDEVFNKYFKAEGFQKQLWLDPDTNEWVDFHKNQDLEWKVFNFARSLNEEAAMKSISMGATQIMGFNYKMLGMSSVKEMFEKFSADAHYHILGFFDYIKSTGNGLIALQKKNFYDIAVIYNGPGQAKRYSKILYNAYLEFKRLV